MKGKKVLIVGGSSGIGLALAKSLGENGADVAIASRSAPDHKDKIQSLPGLGNCTCFFVDITVEAEIKRLLSDVGKIDHLVFTVKHPIARAPFSELELDIVRRAFETKFWGQYNFTRLACRHLNENGSVILSSGTLGKRPYPGFSTMSIIAGAIESLCKALAIELAPIRVNAVCPGFKSLKEMAEKIPLGLGEDSAIANSYLYLLNDAYTTGSIIVSDGGAMLV